MKPEDQIVSLELAKKLKELGVKQDSLFYWIGNCLSFDSKFSIIFETVKWVDDDNCSAFTAAEILQILPNTITINPFDCMTNFRIEITKAILAPDGKTFESHFIMNYRITASTDGDFSKTMLGSNIYDTNLANACAKLLIYLIENKLMEIK